MEAEAIADRIEARAEVAESKQFELEKKTARLLGYNLYSDRQAEEIRSIAERLTAGEVIGPHSPLPISRLGIDGARLARVPKTPIGHDLLVVSPRFWIELQYDMGIDTSDVSDDMVFEVTVGEPQGQNSAIDAWLFMRQTHGEFID